MKIYKMPLRRLKRYGGYGIGSLFSRLGRYMIPILKSAYKVAKPIARKTLKDLSKQGVKVASQTALDVLSGDSPKRAAARNVRRAMPNAKATLKAGAKRGISSVRQSIKEQSGRGFKAKRRKRSAQKKKSKKARKRSSGKARRRRPYRGIFQ